MKEKTACIHIKHLGISIKISRENDSRFVKPDYSSGTRVRHVRTSESAAKEKAKQVCEALATGKRENAQSSPTRIFVTTSGKPWKRRRPWESKSGTELNYWASPIGYRPSQPNFFPLASSTARVAVP
jgi:hypothetical protein